MSKRAAQLKNNVKIRGFEKTSASIANTLKRLPSDQPSAATNRIGFYCESSTLRFFRSFLSMKTTSTPRSPFVLRLGSSQTALRSRSPTAAIKHSTLSPTTTVPRWRSARSRSSESSSGLRRLGERRTWAGPTASALTS